MPFDTYANLQTAILNRINRASDSEAITVCPDWITLAEDEMRMALNRLTVRQGETTDPAFVISSEYTTLPAGFYRQRAIKLNTNPIQFLDWTPPNVADRWDTGSAPSKPKLFTLQGGSLRVFPIPDAAYTAQFTYYALPSLSNSNPSNWLLAAHPKLYLVAAVAEAAAHYENAELAQLYEAKRDQMFSAIYTSDGSDQQGSAMRMRTDTKVI
jgi:hypothetical protein